MIVDVLADLANAKRTMLRDLQSAGAPRTPGIYSLWSSELFLYVGIARVDPKDTRNPQAAGVLGRLDTYRRCRLTSDFAVACAFRFVVPDLTERQRESLATGEFSIQDVQRVVRTWVDSHVSFTAVACDAPTAVEAEREARSRGLPGYGRPVFNAL